MNIIDHLKNLSNSRWYWLFYIAGSVSLLAAALYFQFVHEELPCVMCIQVRLLLSLLILVSIAAVLFHGKRTINTAAHLSTIMIFAGLTERSYMLLGTERGFVFADCGFSLGLPTWFAVEDWLPWLYRVETSCGYTPEVIFGITMAEALMVMSVLFLLFSLVMFIAYFAVLKSAK